MSKGISSSSSSSRRLSRCMRAPLRLLCSIRDLYVGGMSACARKVGQYPSYSDHLAYEHSFSSSSRRSDYDDEDLRELIRAASRARFVGHGARAGVGRSQSVVVGRIDEDHPCEFEKEVKVGSSLIFPRSSSHAGVGLESRRRFA